MGPKISARITRISAGLCAGPPRAGHASLPLVVFRLEVCESWVPGSPVCVSERHWLMCLLCRPLQAPPQVDAATLSRQPVRCLRACVVLGRVRAGLRGPAGSTGLPRDCDQPWGTLRVVWPSKRHDTTPWLQGRRCCSGLPAGDIGLHGRGRAVGGASGQCREVWSGAADVLSWLRR